MVKTLNSDGCEYGRMLKKDLDFVSQKIDDGFRKIGLRLDGFDSNQTNLFNHQSSRVPKEIARKMNWLYGILGSITGGVIVSLIVLIFGRMMSG